MGWDATTHAHTPIREQETETHSEEHERGHHVGDILWDGMQQHTQTFVSLVGRAGNAASTDDGGKARGKSNHTTPNTHTKCVRLKSSLEYQPLPHYLTM